MNPSTASNRPSDPAPAGGTVPDPIAVQENGRTFHGYQQSRYLLPNDGAEQDRLDLQHEIWLRVMNGVLSWCPITQGDPSYVLDIGTGTGRWAIQFARQHPTSSVQGADLSLIQPPDVPANCIFTRQDVEEPWTFKRQFDYVHLRMMASCFGDHKSLMQEIYDNLRPGGWVEYQEQAPATLGADAASEAALRDPRSMREWWRRISMGMATFGKDLMMAFHCKQWLEETGFVDVVERRILCPINGWPTDPKQRELGKLMLENTLTGIEGASLRSLQGLGMSVGEIQAFIAGVLKSVSDPDVHLYYPLYVVYGRKPLVGKDIRN